MRERYAVVVSTPTGVVTHVELYSSLHAAEQAARRRRRYYRTWIHPPDVRVSVKAAAWVVQ